MREIGEFIIRTFSFVRKELIETLRQPRLVALLILGPFLILLIFGLGYTNENRTLNTVIVVPAGSTIRGEIEQFAQGLPGINVTGMVESSEEADRQLLAGEVDLVIITPADPLADVLRGEQAQIILQHREIDPIERLYVGTLERAYINELNRAVLARAAALGQEQLVATEPAVAQATSNATALQGNLRQGDITGAAEDLRKLAADIRLLNRTIDSGMIALAGVQSLEPDEAGDVTEMRNSVERLNALIDELELEDESDEVMSQQADQVGGIVTELIRIQGLLGKVDQLKPDVIARPFEGQLTNVSGVVLGAIDFFVPGTIALLIQHIAVTLAALALVRERRGGSIELFRASPLSALETLLGMSISFLFMGIVLAAVLSLLIAYGLRTPMEGSWVDYAIVTLVLLFGSLGLGFLISSLSKTDTQAVQYSMMVLLASIFFTGFFIALHRLAVPVHILSALLPATWGTSGLQQVMLRGETVTFLDMLIPLILGFAYYSLAWWRTRRQMSSI